MANDGFSFTPVIQSLLDEYAPSILPLTAGASAPASERMLLQQTTAETLFPQARDPEAAVSGLLLLLQQWDASHNVSQRIESVNGSYWHAIAHRMEPDASNAAYWFRRVGNHAIFPVLREEAAAILAKSAHPGWRLKPKWDPTLFIEWCDEARRQPGSQGEQAALAIQRAEWQLLFDWCGRPPR